MSSPARQPSRLGEILVRSGAITQAQLDHALSVQSQFSLPVGETLMRLGYVTDQAMRQALGQQMNVPFLDLDKVVIDRALAGVIDRAFARRHVLMPVTQVGNVLTVAMDDPTATDVVNELAAMTGSTINVVTSSGQAIRGAFRRIYEEAPDAVRSARGDSRVQAASAPEPGGAPIEYAIDVEWRAGACSIRSDGAATTARDLCTAVALGIITDVVHALHDAGHRPESLRLRLTGRASSDAIDRINSLHVVVDAPASAADFTIRRALEMARARFSSAWEALPSGAAFVVEHQAGA